MILNDGEQLDDLEYKGLQIIQREGYYHFTSDSVLLANLTNIPLNAKVLDMGTGSGIIAILIAAKSKAKSVVGIDIQDDMIDMARRSIEINNLNNVRIEKIDIIDAPLQLGFDNFDIVVTNPPYMKVLSGDMSEAEHINISKREVKVTLEQIIVSASKLLKFGGKFYMIHKAERLAEIINIMCKYNLIPKKLINIQPKADKAVDTIIIEGKKGAAFGMTVEALIVYNDDNSYTDKAAKLYSKEQI